MLHARHFSVRGRVGVYSTNVRPLSGGGDVFSLI
jgi:hypothetical protein